MPMNSTTYETFTMLAVAGAPVVFAADPSAAIDVLPISSGLGGAIVATMKSSLFSGKPQPNQPRLAWLSVLVSGGAAAVFLAPAMAEALGWHDRIRWVIFLHFVVGLIGSTLCEVLLQQSVGISQAIATAIGKLAGVHPRPDPTQPIQLPNLPQPEKPSQG